MLAYTFWHWSIPDISAQTYQEKLVAYHQVLFAHRPTGFHSTRVLLLEQAAWVNRSEETYEDWHIVENSAALDPLNERAVSGPCAEPHQQIARLAAGGTGALYQLASGDASLPAVRFAYRFDKPSGMSYSALYELLRPPVQASGGALWLRYMSLGPGPEFCLHCPEQFALPEELVALNIPVRQICFTPHP